MVQISFGSGVNISDKKYIGMTIGKVREELGISASVAKVNSATVEDDYVLKDNDKLEFVAKAGRKG